MNQHELEARFAAARKRLQTIGVTGTNGKTTTVSMIDAIVAASGEPSARLTTLGASVAGKAITAPDPTTEFLATVEEAVGAGVRTLALEVTSKALAGGLAKGWPADIAVFTNLSRDHLDMHGSPEHYLAAKAQLFIALPPHGTAILNSDDDNADLIAEVCSHAARRRFSVRGTTRDRAIDLAAHAVEVSADGLHIDLAPSALADELNRELQLGVIGRVHAQNALAAALATAAAGYAPPAITNGLAAFRGVPGRFEIAHRAPLVAIDYAHTPDGLRGTLDTARELVGSGGKLICVFGCGGERDKGKRPEMGRVADTMADFVVLTSDNPRREDPRGIADDVRTGAEPIARWLVELDRPTAIERALDIADPSDVVVVAGKGHETVQEIGGESIEMSDRDIVRELFDVD